MSEPSPVAGEPLAIALVGAGPTAASVLERLIANVDELLADRPVVIHLVDPHRAGTGRVWRPDLDPLLWMNSMAEDVTMFTDATVTCAGPIRPGPSLFEWSNEIDDDELATLAPPELVAEIRRIGPMTFPTRRVQSAYLEWFHRQVLAAVPANVAIVVHPRRAVDLIDGDDGRQWIVLEGLADQIPADRLPGDAVQPDTIPVDTVVLSLGHLDAEPDDTSRRFARFAGDHGLAYIPPGHTAEQDLSVLGPGDDVIALGFGQAFTDLAILVTEGRGGRFVDRADGTIGYEPSGHEPVLHVGSRRGVPYRAKPDYRLQAPLARLPRFLDDAALEQLLGLARPLEFDTDLLPLLSKEVAWAYYHELFAAHPERTSTSWDDFAARYAPLDWGADIDRLVAETVPDPSDRFSIDALDRPLAGVRLDTTDDFQRHLHEHIAADVARRTDAAHSADLAAFMAMLISFGSLGRIGASGRLTERSRVERLNGWWFAFFMYYASGPPPRRLQQLLALADAGLLRFIGADTVVTADDTTGCFVATSTSHPDCVVASALVDARIATPSVLRTADPLLRRMHQRGDVVEEIVADGADGHAWSGNTGKVVVAGPDMRLRQADGSTHPRRRALGIFTNRPAAGAFARPRTNAPVFRQNDAVARALLTDLCELAADRRALAESDRASMR